MGESRLRLDKWLWHARFHKTRSLAAVACESGRIRVNGASTTKSHHAVRPGDVLTFLQGARIRVVRVVALGVRRGPATEARTLYEDLSEDLVGDDPAISPAGTAPRCSGDPGPAVRQGGRPTKADRRATDRLRDRE